ncbi:MAG TPA: lysophospholipid acyltransferase family protein, partial [Mycobacteriales bacterium]|nr:lysophospholipid acyltransferase family protein [Mycobacteriales bacterium]
AGNHRGLIDGPVVAAGLRRRTVFLAKAELFVGPLAWLLGWLGQIPVHRGRPDRAALRQARAVLAGGGLVGIFPEGTRGAGALEEVQHGIAYLALHTHGCPIVPVACLGTETAWPRGARLPRWRTGVEVVFGPAFTVVAEGDPRTRRAVAAAAEQIRVALADHVRAVESGRL